MAFGRIRNREWLASEGTSQHGKGGANSVVVVIACTALVVAISLFSSGSKATGPNAAPLPNLHTNLRVGTWNVQKLGHGERKDYGTVARVIEEYFDVVALVEVMQEARTHPGYDNLLMELGLHWKGMVTETPRPKSNAGSAEYYAVLFRENNVGVCQGWEGLVYHRDNDGTQGEEEPDLFEREPGFTCLQSERDGTKTGVDFMLAVYHARWSGGIKRRREEVMNLSNVFSAMGEARPGGEGPNHRRRLQPDSAADGEGTGAQAQVIRSRVHAKFTRRADEKCLRLPAGARPRRNFGDDRTAKDYRRETFRRRHLSFRQSVSDHLPVVAVLMTDGEDDD